ncbi:flagellar hook-associated protein FlgK [Photobacterium jeanii]|uniref:Flagellar hook-associated protein 1 n=1 Tax=Photobacterium jeanii TaxID=858640 RepID=A0A178KHH3_9GAMM|nr:flagellar hook-associated protein FlgK [Photobacterium jeanii]OAN16719.1 flagellar hook-associated protein FlgK [Photobacterium jeanii]PST87449.1 flagellar hook-associated protein FlgK [Photobacterium jeanii]
MSLINIGLSGMNAANAGLSVTAHNVSNVMTPGYSRQRVGFGAQTGADNRGAGVGVSNVERLADNYLNQQIYRQRGSWGYNAISTQYMKKTQTVLNNDSTSVSKGLDRFYAALNEASAKPQDVAYRQTIVSQSKSMVQRFNNMSSQLDSQEKQIKGQLDASISEANTLMASIASLNSSIRDAGGDTQSTSSLLDARDEAIRQLSSMMDVNPTYNDDGTVTLTMAKGQTLVSGDTASKLEQDHNGELLLRRGEGKLALDENLGGTIGGLINYRDTELVELRRELDVMAYSFATEFNEKHQQGFDLNGEQGKPVFGGVDSVEGAAGKLTLLVDDPKQLAFSSKADEPGNSENLQGLIELKNAPINVDKTKLSADELEKYGNVVDKLNGKSIYDNYTGLTGDWAIKTAQMESDAKASDTLVKQAQGERDSKSGVNLDEEAASIMTYTQMYQANAKVISTAQQLFDVTLSMFN